MPSPLTCKAHQARSYSLVFHNQRRIPSGFADDRTLKNDEHASRIGTLVVDITWLFDCFVKSTEWFAGGCAGFSWILSNSS